MKNVSVAGFLFLRELKLNSFLLLSVANAVPSSNFLFLLRQGFHLGIGSAGEIFLIIKGRLDDETIKAIYWKNVFLNELSDRSLLIKVHPRQRQLGAWHLKSEMTRRNYP